MHAVRGFFTSAAELRSGAPEIKYAAIRLLADFRLLFLKGAGASLPCNRYFLVRCFYFVPSVERRHRLPKISDTILQLYFRQAVL